jgi:hypothetical protein
MQIEVIFQLFEIVKVFKFVIDMLSVGINKVSYHILIKVYIHINIIFKLIISILFTTNFALNIELSIDITSPTLTSLFHFTINI